MQKREQLIVEGVSREFLIYIPNTMPHDEQVPVIISFHGTLGSAVQMMSFADFRPIAEREKVLIVCPEGITQTWNDGRATKANLQGVDDVGFVKVLISHLYENFSVDPKQVFLTGMSNGGFMVSRLACELPDMLTAIGVVAATMDRASGLHPAQPLPALYIHGTRDRLVPYEGGATKAAGGDVYSHNEIIKLWVSINQCLPEPVETITPDQAGDSTSVIKKEFSNTDTGIIVCDYTIVNGGHTWPDGPQYAAINFVGLVSHNLNACEAIWAFFKQYL
jgi:polyhydroxybutyrate depolymerase